MHAFGRWTDRQTEFSSLDCLCIPCRDAESSFFVGLPTPWFKKLVLRVKVGHWLLNLCDCDSDTVYWVNDEDRQILKIKKNKPVLLRSYLNLISVIVCSKQVHLWFGLRVPTVRESQGILGSQGKQRGSGKSRNLKYRSLDQLFMHYFHNFCRLLGASPKTPTGAPPL